MEEEPTPVAETQSQQRRRSHLSQQVADLEQRLRAQEEIMARLSSVFVATPQSNYYTRPYSEYHDRPAQSRGRGRNNGNYQRYSDN